ncbi:MAG: zinc ABC transporter substrate-binding protein [Alphaproteobacteria bacterium]|nr:zinc ABC transporter substrate-binding protein [Alphaproteobacteria bacterium]
MVPLVALGLIPSFGALAGETPKVVASIAPLHSLAASVMAGVGEPELLLQANASAHDFSLKPSQVRILQRADLVLWVGPEFESFLTKPVTSLGGKGRVLTMSDLPGMLKLKMRKGDFWESHAHGEGHNVASSFETDGHLWLDIGNAKLFAAALADRLSIIDPLHAGLYQRNASALALRLNLLDSHLKVQLAPLAARPYVVFHDAFQYFEKRYGLSPLGSITHDERKPSAKALAALRGKISDSGGACIFKEPQASPRLAEILAEGLRVRIGSLDDLGAGLKPGPQMFDSLMTGLADSLKECLDSSAGE